MTAPRFELQAQPWSGEQVSVLAVPIVAAEPEPPSASAPADSASSPPQLQVLGGEALRQRLPQLTERLQQARARADAGALTTIAYPDVLVHAIGVGQRRPADLRRAAAAMAKAATGHPAIGTWLHAVGTDTAGDLTAVVVGAGLAAFTYTLRQEPANHPAPVEQILLYPLPDATSQPTEQLEPVLAQAEAVMAASWQARSWATVPSNLKSPAWLAEQARELAQQANLTYQEWDEDELAADGFGGILAVGGGSASPPRLVQLTYRPDQVTDSTAQVVLVGKGITFDSGGLSIKPAQAMSTMKRDMTGAAVVMATMGALAAVKSPLTVTALLPMAENAVGEASMRPDDVITHWGGRTTEVGNTDAEGRLILADALAYAAAELSPDLIIDVATLTGAMKVALGQQLGGFFATSAELSQQVMAASRASGERVWQLPLASAEYAHHLDSPIADATNNPKGPGAITAALFLRPFVGEHPWVHFDIASVGDAPKPDAEWTAGPTGFGVRLLLEWLGSTTPIRRSRP